MTIRDLSTHGLAIMTRVRDSRRGLAPEGPIQRSACIRLKQLGLIYSDRTDSGSLIYRISKRGRILLEGGTI